MDTPRTFSGALAETIADIPEERWAYLQYRESISDQIAQYMESHNITKADLARRLGKTRAYATKVLRGDMNLTMATLVSIVHVLEAELITHIVPKSEGSWYSIPAEKHMNSIFLSTYKRTRDSSTRWQTSSQSAPLEGFIHAAA